MKDRKAMMSDFPEQSMAEPIPPQHPALFRRYVQKSARAALARLQQAGTTFPDEVRDRALHVLRFALQVDEAWPAARDLLLALAPRMEMAGHRDDWLPYLQQGLACSRQTNDPLAAAELQLQIGHLYRLLSQFEPARQALDASAAEFATLGNANGQARACNELGYLAWHQHRYTDAQHLAEAALACLADTDWERATSLSVLGLVAIDLRHWQEGENYFKEALQIRRIHGDRQRMAWNLQHLGYVLHRQCDFAAAIPYYEDAIQILIEVHDLLNCAITQMSVGIVNLLMEQADKALKMFIMAESFFRKSHDLLHIAKISTNKGLAYLALREWQQAKNAFADSVSLYEKLHNFYGSLNALDGLGLAHNGLGEYDKAIEVFESALTRLPLIKDDPGAELLEEELTIHLRQAHEEKREHHRGVPL